MLQIDTNVYKLYRLVLTTVTRCHLIYVYVMCVCDLCLWFDRHQATDGASSENSAKVKKAASLLQQRKILQRNLRNLQQHTLSREILASELQLNNSSSVSVVVCFVCVYVCFVDVRLLARI